MIQSNKYLMIMLRLSKEPAGSKYHKILSSSRRCLEDFSLPFGDTGYRLVLRSEEAKLLECLTEGFMGYFTSDDMVILSAPERDEYGEYYYASAEQSLLDDLSTELTKVATRVRSGNRITSRTYAEAIRLVNRAEHHMQTEETQTIRKAISSIWKEDVSKKRKSTARYLDELADYLVLAEEEDEE